MSTTHNPDTCPACDSIKRQNPEAWAKWLKVLGIMPNSR